MVFAVDSRAHRPPLTAQPVASRFACSVDADAGQHEESAVVRTTRIDCRTGNARRSGSAAQRTAASAHAAKVRSAHRLKLRAQTPTFPLTQRLTVHDNQQIRYNKLLARSTHCWDSLTSEWFHFFTVLSRNQNNYLQTIKIYFSSSVRLRFNSLITTIGSIVTCFVLLIRPHSFNSDSLVSLFAFIFFAPIWRHLSLSKPSEWHSMCTAVTYLLDFPSIHTYSMIDFVSIAMLWKYVIKIFN